MANQSVSRAVIALSVPAYQWTDVVAGNLPEEARFVRMLGCPDTRQFEVLEMGYALFVREVATKANPTPGSAVARLWLADVLKGMAADVLKGNDAMEGVAQTENQHPKRAATNQKSEK